MRNEFWHVFIPNLSLSISSAQTGKRHTTALVMAKQGTGFNIRQSSLGTQVSTDFSDRHIRDLIVIVGYMLERARQQHGVYTVHGSLVSINDKGVALLGGITGIGKTTIAAACAQHIAGGKFLSDEKFCIDGVSGAAVGGTRIVPASAKLKKSLADRRIVYRKSTDDIASPVPIRLIVFPVLTKGVRGDTVEAVRYTMPQLYWHLYEEASRDIRLINGLVDSFLVPLPSLDSQPLAKNRAIRMWRCAQKIPAFLVIGNHAGIYRFIERFVNTSV